MSNVVPKSRYGLSNVPGQIPNYANLTYLDIFTGIYAEQTAINYPLVYTNIKSNINIF